MTNDHTWADHTLAKYDMNNKYMKDKYMRKIIANVNGTNSRIVPSGKMLTIIYVFSNVQALVLYRPSETLLNFELGRRYSDAHRNFDSLSNCNEFVDKRAH